MRVWCVACFLRLWGLNKESQLSNVYVFSSFQKATTFLETTYLNYHYDDYEIYESDIDIVN